MIPIRVAVVCLVGLFCLMYASPPAEAAVVPERETLASCYGYGDGFAGRLTANGTPFDPHSDTVAHRWLPFGTPVLFRVGDSFQVGIVRDRGPFIWDREFDVSCGLMERLGLPPGVYPVWVS